MLQHPHNELTTRCAAEQTKIFSSKNAI